ncbi:Bug family tripartite tricarboxylate transporter substrate binding protein [Sulfitobacter aestuarii]|uniref:Bug family tripartite tricarboxylate transporter substrate binding protein n=1 Tax=Sulfitobacter aestuarii TaxID=2161676 RepID=A0ABW5U973_9RHOB
MKHLKISALAIAALVSLGAGAAMAQEKEKAMDSVHFLIPGGAGGGWDGTARGVGEALKNSGLVDTVTFENMSGGGGGKALNYVVENAQSNEGTLMVHSTPIIVRALNKTVDMGFRDVTPVAGVIGDYAAVVVGKDSDYESWDDLYAAFQEDPRGVAIGGGSAPGSMDHLVPAAILQEAGSDPLDLRYVAYDAGGKAMAGLLSGEIAALSTGLSEAIALAEAGEVRILGVTAPERVEAAPDAPTFKELGVDMEFVNWRGFFGAPGLPEDKRNAYADMLKEMTTTEAWAKVRDRNGWIDIYNAGEDFTAYLENQEADMQQLMTNMGFIQ